MTTASVHDPDDQADEVRQLADRFYQWLGSLDDIYLMNSPLDELANLKEVAGLPVTTLRDALAAGKMDPVTVRELMERAAAHAQGRGDVIAVNDSAPERSGVESSRAAAGKMLTDQQWRAVLDEWVSQLEVLASRAEVLLASRAESPPNLQAGFADDVLQLRRLILRVKAGAQPAAAEVARQMANAKNKERFRDFCGQGFINWLEAGEPLGEAYLYTWCVAKQNQPSQYLRIPGGWLEDVGEGSAEPTERRTGEETAAD